MISRIYPALPPHGARQSIGIFGGSFDPPHSGHRAASLVALTRVGLDQVWWLPTAGNPLKDTSALPALQGRILAAAQIAAHPRIAISGFERFVGSPYTCDLLVELRRRCPQVHFVLLMGADAFADLPRWKRWRSIIGAVPICVVDRPGSTLSAVRSRAAYSLAAARLDEHDAVRLPRCRPPAYVFLHGRRSTQSSTALRLSARRSEKS